VDSTQDARTRCQFPHMRTRGPTCQRQQATCTHERATNGCAHLDTMVDVACFCVCLRLSLDRPPLPPLNTPVC
jgi:hypothetical protein